MTFAEATGSTRGLDVSVVIPVCNEQDSVEPLAREIHQALIVGRSAGRVCSRSPRGTSR